MPKHRFPLYARLSIREKPRDIRALPIRSRGRFCRMRCIHGQGGCFSCSPFDENSGTAPSGFHHLMKPMPRRLKREPGNLFRPGGTVRRVGLRTIDAALAMTAGDGKWRDGKWRDGTGAGTYTRVANKAACKCLQLYITLFPGYCGSRILLLPFPSFEPAGPKSGCTRATRSSSRFANA